jgi:holliday junction resolvase YEN1
VYTETAPHALPTAISAWRASLCRYLATDPDKLIGRKNKALASSIPESFPPIEVLEAYIRPLTSESEGKVPHFAWAKQPSLKEIANNCERNYEWGVKPLIIKRFRTVIWGGALMRVLRAAVMQGDEKEAGQARRMETGIPFTPKNGRRVADLAVGTPSKLITQCLSRLELESPRRLRDVDPFSNESQPILEDEPLLVKIHSLRTHASTDGVLEYRVEIAPAQFVRMTEEGLLGLKSEDSIDVANFGKRKALLDDDEDFGDVDEDGSGAGKKGKETAKPNDHMRIWVPACMLEMVQPSLVEEFEGIAAAKEQKKRDKEQRAKDKAEGKVVPKKSRAVGTGSPSKAKAARMALMDAGDDTQASQPTRSKKPGPTKKFVSGGSSDEDIEPTPRAKMATQVRPLDLRSKFFGDGSPRKRDDPLSETDYMSTESITERRRGKATGSIQSLPILTSRPPVPATVFPSKSAAGSSSSRTAGAPSVLRFPPIPNDPRNSMPTVSRHFMFTMKPDVSLEEVVPSDEEEDLNPYAALVEAHSTTSNSSRTSSNRPTGASKTGNVTKSLRGNGKIDMEFDESPIRKPIRRSQDSVEDFSYLFQPSPTTRKKALPVPGDDCPQPTSAKPAPPKRRNKFVSASDSSDEAPRVQKSPKKSKAGKSLPDGPLDRLTTKPKAKKIVASVPRPADGVQAKRKEKGPVSRIAEVINISDSSDEELALPKSTRATNPRPVVPRGEAQTVRSRGRSGKGRGDVSIIDLDD